MNDMEIEELLRLSGQSAVAEITPRQCAEMAVRFKALAMPVQCEAMRGVAHSDRCVKPIGHTDHHTDKDGESWWDNLRQCEATYITESCRLLEGHQGPHCSRGGAVTWSCP